MAQIGKPKFWMDAGRIAKYSLRTVLSIDFSFSLTFGVDQYKNVKRSVALINPYKSRKTRLTWINYLRLSSISSAAVCVIKRALYCFVNFYLWCHFSK